MELLTPTLRFALRANAIQRHVSLDRAREAAQRVDRAEPDPAPVVKFFDPVGAAIWLATELDRDGDTLFGLADLGFGCPELGYFSLRELAAVRVPFGLGIERDIDFASPHPLSVWADAARAAGSIMGAAHNLLLRSPNPLPPAPDPDGHGEGG